MLDWFKSIKQHHFYKFVIFGITEFYTSIKEAFLKKALDFAEAYTDKPGSKKKVNCWYFNEVAWQSRGGGGGSVFKTKDTIFAILNSAKKNYKHMNIT